ncbi:MAG: metal-dependent hydrolase [Candidatus Binatia bacterium]
MPTVFTHGIVGLTASQLWLPNEVQRDSRAKRLFTALSIVLPILPDFDFLFVPIVRHESLLDHRGLFHSIVFALVLGVVATGLMVAEFPGITSRRLSLFAYFSIIAASHGLLDSMTRGPQGVALFAPFDNDRYFFPVRPMLPSPIWPSEFFSSNGARVLGIEFLLVWTVCCGALIAQRKLMPIALLFGGRMASLVHMFEKQHKLTAVTLLLLAAIAWVVRII